MSGIGEVQTEARQAKMSAGESRGEFSALDGRSRCWHLITSEYPPQIGGVSDYTHLLSAGLAEQGEEVHVWCPQVSNASAAHFRDDGIAVHRAMGAVSSADLRKFDLELARFPEPRRLLIQWVPHGYGYRSMNVAFCRWVRQRALRYGDQVELMVHEPFLSFRPGVVRQNAVALVHRFMTVLLLSAARRVWVSIPAWEERLRPYCLGRKVKFQWLPIFSNVPVAGDAARASEIRRRYVNGNRLLIGHFGTYGSLIAQLLEPILVKLCQEPESPLILLIGNRSEEFCRKLVQTTPALADSIRGTGPLPADELSCHIAACDLLVQPYPDGVSSRRTSFMAGLSHGKPVVTTQGSLSETLWTQTDGVATVPVGDTDGFIRSIRQLSLPSERQRVGRAAQQLYNERFDISRTIAALRLAVTP